MTEKVAKTASELLKLKSQYIDDLSKLMDKKKENWQEGYHYLSLCYGYDSGFISLGYGKPRLNVDSNVEIHKKVNNLLITELNREIAEIDEKLQKLTC